MLHHANGIEAVWSQVERRLGRMTPDECRQSLVRAGILTKDGRVAKPYARVFRKLKEA